MTILNNSLTVKLMNRIFILKSLAFLYKKIAKPYHPRWSWPSNEKLERQYANDDILELLSSKDPCFIGRIGTVEGQIVFNYLSIHSNRNIFSKALNYIKGDAHLPWWDKGKPFFELQNNAGFFSEKKINIEDVEKFCKIYLKYIPTMDLCGCFEYYERFLPFNSICKKHQLETLYPFLVDRSWMRALKDKHILVIHPFKNTIEQQYAKRKKLFINEEWLPEFASLKVIKAVQTVAGEKSKFKNWFEALEYMKQEIYKSSFDIAIIGCGAYGLPLAGYCKEIGKKAIHMGGGTQLLFGIKGKRWEIQYKNSCYRDMFNKDWCYPDETEIPNNAKKVEGGCYW